MTTLLLAKNLPAFSNHAVNEDTEVAMSRTAEVEVEVEGSLWPRREAARSSLAAAPVRRSRSREEGPRLRRPPRWSARVLQSRVA
ncbi:MAG: hypothetical protein IPJ65_31310 [Archangiaceae bacterium]|nr:hypothetical protein [Archangiaceae bacterium]